jgi:hypothetical protein
MPLAKALRPQHLLHPSRVRKHGGHQVVAHLIIGLGVPDLILYTVWSVDDVQLDGCADKGIHIGGVHNVLRLRGDLP